MKLFQKICLQIFLAMLVLAAGMLWFLVWEMQSNLFCFPVLNICERSDLPGRRRLYCSINDETKGGSDAERDI